MRFSTFAACVSFLATYGLPAVATAQSMEDMTVWAEELLTDATTHCRVAFADTDAYLAEFPTRMPDGYLHRSGTTEDGSAVAVVSFSGNATPNAYYNESAVLDGSRGSAVGICYFERFVGEAGPVLINDALQAAIGTVMPDVDIIGGPMMPETLEPFEELYGLGIMPEYQYVAAGVGADPAITMIIQIHANALQIHSFVSQPPVR